MIRQNKKLFYNAIIDEDLFFAIYDYIRFNSDYSKNYYNITTTCDFDKLTVENWKDLADDVICWLEYEQLPNVTKLYKDDPAPSLDSWGTLYYQTLNYMSIKEAGQPTLRNRDFNDTMKVCINCIEYLKEKMDEIREINDEDLYLV